MVHEAVRAGAWPASRRRRALGVVIPRKLGQPGMPHISQDPFEAAPGEAGGRDAEDAVQALHRVVDPQATPAQLHAAGRARCVSPSFARFRRAGR